MEKPMKGTQAGTAHRAGRSTGYQSKLNKSSRPAGGHSASRGGGRNNNVGRSDTDSGSGGSNHGASTGLMKSNEMRADVTNQVSNDNPYPDGMA